jgi:hypothetical protein
LENLRFFKGDRRRPLIYDLLVKWDEVLHDLESVFSNEDLPYVYGERTNIGIIAAAASRLGYHTLEEFYIPKRRRKSKRAGRADLYIVSKDGAKDFVFEAKLIKISFGSKRVVSEAIQGSLKDCMKQVGAVREQAQKAIGIVFVRPYHAKPDFEPDHFWDQVNNTDIHHADFSALHLAKFDIWSKQKEHKGCPGIAIVGQYLR